MPRQLMLGKSSSLDILWDAANPNDHAADPNPAGGKTYPHTIQYSVRRDFKRPCDHLPDRFRARIA